MQTNTPEKIAAFLGRYEPFGQSGSVIYDEMILVVSNGIQHSTDISALERISLYKEWLEDGREFVSDKIGGDDKFAELLVLCRHFDATSEFFIDSVGVNAATVWRWATKKSRPNKYLAKTLVDDLNKIIIKQLNKDIEVLKTDRRRLFLVPPTSGGPQNG